MSVVGSELVAYSPRNRASAGGVFPLRVHASSPVAYQNKAKVYGLLFKAASETLTTIAADRRHLGAEIGILAVLHSWGQNLQHHPHVHCIVPGGGISLDGTRWIASRPGFFLPVRVLSRLFRRLFVEGLMAAFEASELQFFGDLAPLKRAKEFAGVVATLRTTEWVVYAKDIFTGPERVLAYLARYTHRVAITNRRLLDLDQTHVSFRWEDYRKGARRKNKVMRIEAGEFMRRFLLHILPNGFHRIRHYGLLANGHRVRKVALCRSLLAAPAAVTDSDDKDNNNDPKNLKYTLLPSCPCCGGQMFVVESFMGSLCRPYPVRILDGL